MAHTRSPLSFNEHALKMERLSTLRLPVIGAPMFIVSGPELVMAQCRAGIVGTFPALNARSSELLDQWITSLKSGLKAEGCATPFGVNLIANRKANPRLDTDAALCVKHQVPLVITSYGLSTEVIEAVHGYGGLVFHDVINHRHAQKALEAGADGLILVCAGAGGHGGTLNPLAFVDEVRRFHQGPLAVSGCISTGRGVAAVRAMGANFAYMGTRFIATQEANAPEAYKRMILDSRSEDIVYTPYFTGVSANFLAPSINTDVFDMEAVLTAGPGKISPMDETIKAWRDVWGAGQGVGAISDCPDTASLVNRLVSEYEQARKDVAPT